MVSLVIVIHHLSTQLFSPLIERYINAEMVRKQDSIEYPYLPNDCLFHHVFLLSMAIGNAFISCLWHYNYGKRYNKNNNANAPEKIR